MISCDLFNCLQFLPDDTTNKDYSSSIVEGYPVFSNRLAAEIILESLSFLQNKRKTALYTYVIMENHIHLIIQSEEKKPSHTDSDLQVWQEGFHSKQVVGDSTMIQKIEYIHDNPVQRGLVDLSEDWRYSSARNYLGNEGLIPITLFEL